jgi:hypothetical protein
VQPGLRWLFDQAVIASVVKPGNGVSLTQPGCPSSSTEAAAALAAEVCVVHLHRARQPVTVLALCHGLHQLVVNQPGRGVADAQGRFKARADRPVLAWLTR